MFSIAKWYNNYQSPSVLMIDDLSDAYIEANQETYKNDWGYYCNKKNSAYVFLKQNLLKKFPQTKITFFVPYARHNVINENSALKHEKFAIGEREEFSSFLRELTNDGHEISHHGSNHGEYANKKNLSTLKNFTHEWALFKTVEEGVTVTQKGRSLFKNAANINLAGGKFCGYIQKENSLEIIDSCNFLYWCNGVNFITKSYSAEIFGKNNIINFPTNYAGNSFVRLSYKTGDKQRDKKKKIMKYFQPLYNILSYHNLNKLYNDGEIISIQEHISPSTTSGNIQSANIVSDIKSLNLIYTSLSKKSIWYATCEEIASYLFVRENISWAVENNLLKILFNNYKNINHTQVTLTAKKSFALSTDKTTYHSLLNNNIHVLNIPLVHGENIFIIEKELTHA